MDKPFGYERRRHGDRRSSARPGKYERRRNICSVCHFFKPQGTVAGLCLKHQTMIKGEDFACTFFVLATPSAGEPE